MHVFGLIPFPNVGGYTFSYQKMNSINQSSIQDIAMSYTINKFIETKIWKKCS